MTVGLNMEASPFVPFLILLDVSIIVNGVEYPIRTPHNKQTNSVIDKKVHDTLRNTRFQLFKIKLC